MSPEQYEQQVNLLSAALEKERELRRKAIFLLESLRRHVSVQMRVDQRLSSAIQLLRGDSSSPGVPSSPCSANPTSGGPTQQTSEDSHDSSEELRNALLF